MHVLKKYTLEIVIVTMDMGYDQLLCFYIEEKPL